MQQVIFSKDWLAVLDEKEFILVPENERVKREDVVRVWTIDKQVLAEVSRGRFLVLGEIPDACPSGSQLLSGYPSCKF